MAEERKLTLHEIADARGHLDALCKEIGALKMELARLPSRAYVSRTVFTATVTISALLGAATLLLMR